jgi:hypothetical protein
MRGSAKFLEVVARAMLKEDPAASPASTLQLVAL